MNKKTLSALGLVAVAGMAANPSPVSADTLDNQPVVIESQSAQEVKQPSLEETRASVSNLEVEVEQARTAYQELEAETTSKQAELTGTTLKTKELDQAIDMLGEERTAAEEALPEARQDLSSAQEAYASEVAKHPSLADDLEAADQAYKESLAEKEQESKDLAQARSQQDKAEQDVKNNQDQLDKLKAEKTQTSQLINETQAALTISRTALSTAKSQLDHTESEINQEVSRLEEAITAAGQDTVLTTRTLQVATVDGSRQVESKKSTSHEQLLYAGTTTVEKELSPEQLVEYKEKGYFTYKPNAAAVTEHMAKLLRELRTLNGISLPVPEASPEAITYASQRVNEINSTRVLSHDTTLDTTDRNAENAGILNVSLVSNGVNPILSDEQMAYYLLNLYFADYENLYSGYGHRVSLLTGSGTGLGNAFAGRYHVMTFMDYGKLTDTPTFSSDYWSVMSGFTYDNDTENTMYYNGKRLTFLPRTSFSYVTKVTEVQPNLAKAQAEKALSDYRATAQGLRAKALTAVTQAEGDLRQQTGELNKAEQHLWTIDQLLEQQEQTIEQVKLTRDQLRTKVQELISSLEVKTRTVDEKQALLEAVSVQAKSLVTAKNHLSASQERLANLEATVTDKTAQLTRAIADREIAQNNIARLSDDLSQLLPQRDQAKLAYEAARTKLAEATTLLANLEVRAILSRPLNIPSKPSTQAVLVTETIKTVSSSGKLTHQEPAKVSGKSAAKKTLPATGEETSVLLSSLGLILSATGLVFKKRNN